MRTSGSNRSFGLVFAVFFAIITGLRWWAVGAEWPIWLVVAVLFLLISFTMPRVLAPLRRGWLRLGAALAFIINPLVLGLIYVFSITGIGLIVRMFGKDMLGLKVDPAAKTYWIKRDPPGPARDSLSNQF
jgi:saxitoxin biosynthesis operon SxtJ-like protein